MSRAPSIGFFAHGSETYRYRLSSLANGVAQWTVTRTEAAIVETPQGADQAQLESIILTDFGPGTPGEPPEPSPVIKLGEVCGACGVWVPGGTDPVVMSAHDCEGEEDE